MSTEDTICIYRWLTAGEYVMYLPQLLGHVYQMLIYIESSAYTFLSIRRSLVSLIYDNCHEGFRYEMKRSTAYRL